MVEDLTGDAGAAATALRLGVVPGVMPATWVRTWRERHAEVTLALVPLAAVSAEQALRTGDVDAALLRPPVDRTVLSAIPLYAESPVVVVSTGHLLAALEPGEALTLADLADEVVLRPQDDVLPWSGAPDDAAGPPGTPAQYRPATTRDAVELVAAGAGVLVVPQSLARLHHRKDVTYRVIDDGPLAPVALAWVTDRTDDRIEDLIGIVRGRTVNSSRGTGTPSRREPRSEPSRATGTVPRSPARRAPRGRPRRRGR